MIVIMNLIIDYLRSTRGEDLPKALKLFEFIHYIAFNMDYDLAGEGSFDTLDEKTKQILTRYRKSIVIWKSTLSRRADLSSPIKYRARGMSWLSRRLN